MPLGLVVLLFLAGLGWGQTTLPVQPATQPVRAGKTAVLDVHDEINDYSARRLEKRLAEAKAAGIDTIVLDIDTPGGLVSAALDMSRALKRETMHTIAYVNPTAYSAGTMISVACDEIVMAPGGMIGDCAPIVFGAEGLQQLQGAERAKAESPIVADFEESAEQNGYDVLLVRSFVQYKVTVHYVQGPDGKRKFVLPAEYERLLKDGWKPVEGVKDPVDDDSTLLTVSNSVAERLGISKGTYASVDALAAARGLTIVRKYETGSGEKFILLLGSPTVRGLLSAIFMFALYTAFSKPGTGLPETVAVISGVLLLGVPLMTGYATWLEILLIVLGVALLAIEIFLIPGFGVTGISGIVLILAGLVMTFVPSEGPALPSAPGMPNILPQLPQTQYDLKQGLVIVVSGMAVSLGLWFWLARYLVKIPYMNRLVLQTTVGSTPEPGDDPARIALESAWPEVGSRGVALTELKPGGMGRFFDPIINDDRNIDVISDLGFVPAGTSIVIRKKEGPEVVVRALK